MRPTAPVPDALLRLAACQGGLVSARQCEDSGVGERRRAVLVGSGAWARLTRGVYDTRPASGARAGSGVRGPATFETRRPAAPGARGRATLATGRPPAPGSRGPAALDPRGQVAPDERRRRSAWLALLAYGPSAVAVGACALALHGVAGLPLTIEPQAAVAKGLHRRDRDGVRLREFDAGMETVVLDGRRVASVTWALAQSVPELDRRHAVAVMDSALNQGLIDDVGLRRAHELARGRRGVARTHGWWSEADGRAESPLETFARLDCADAGAPPDDLQVVLTDERGAFVARADLGWRIRPGRWLVAEVDGREWHDSPEALLNDRRRQNAIVRADAADLLRFTAADLAEPGYVGTQVVRFLSRARGYEHHSAR